MFISSQSGGARWVNGGLSSLAPDNSYPADRDDSETRVPLAARLPPACALVAPRLGFMAATRLKLRYPPQVFAEKLLFLSGSLISFSVSPSLSLCMCLLCGGGGFLSEVS